MMITKRVVQRMLIVALWCAACIVTEKVFAQDIVGIYEIRNRVGRALPVAIVPLVLPNTEVRRLRVQRCSDGTDMPFYVEPWTENTDSVVCWVRIDDLGGGARLTVNVVRVPTQTTSRSSGPSTFLAFSDNITPRVATTDVGPLSTWTGTPPEFGNGLIVEAHVRATGVGGGLFGYFGASNGYTKGFLVRHSTIPGSTTPDHYRFENGDANEITTAHFEWQVNEPVRYSARITADSNIIIRTSETDNKRVHQLRTERSETDWEWLTFGAASFATHPNTFDVDWVRVRPWIELPPTVTRRASSITTSPSNAAICNGVPVVLQGPSGWQSYKWSTGATTQTLQASTIGDVSLTVGDATGCTITFPSIKITRDTIPSVGPDTAFTLCLGRSELIRVREQYSSYKWYISTGVKQALVAQGVPSLKIDSADVYTCIVGSAGGCSDTILFRVSRVFDTTARISASNPGLTLCDGDSITLYVTPSNTEYTWYRDSVQLPFRSDRIVVRTAGVYAVAVKIGDSTNACISTARVEIRQNVRQELNLDSSYTICEGSPLRVGVPDSMKYTTFEWSTKETTRSIDITRPGSYWLFASYNGTCGDTTRFTVTVNPSPPVRIAVQDDRTSMCTGEQLQLTATAGTGATYTWSTGETTPLITITKPGPYTVQATYPNGCVRTDSIMINDGLAIPDIISLDYQTLCPGQSTRLTTVGHFDTYLWSTGETTDTIRISAPGSYWVEVTLFECSARRDFIIKPTEPGGLVLGVRDTTATCEVSPLIDISITSNQDVRRFCFLTVLQGPVDRTQDTIYIDEYATVGTTFSVRPNTPPGIYRIRYRIEDNCGWNEEHSFYINHGGRDLPVGIAFQAPIATSVRAGDRISVELRGTNSDGLQRMFASDSVTLTVRMNPDLFHITSASATCGSSVSSINDRDGIVTYVLTQCTNGTVTPFISQQVTVLVGESLDGWIRVDSVRGTNPCFSFPVLSDKIPVEPFGCSISTIERRAAPIISVVGMDEHSVSITVSSHDQHTSVRCVDAVGRMIEQRDVDNADSSNVITLRRPHGPFFVQAVNEHGATSLPLTGALR